MKKVLRIALVVLCFLLWFMWCFNITPVAIRKAVIDEAGLSALPIWEIPLLVILIMAFFSLFAVLYTVAFLIVSPVVQFISKTVLRALGLHQQVKAVDTLYSKDNVIAYSTCLIILILIIITCIEKADFINALFGLFLPIPLVPNVP